jgi:hypothetical protein
LTEVPNFLPSLFGKRIEAVDQAAGADSKVFGNRALGYAGVFCGMRKGRKWVSSWSGICGRSCEKTLAIATVIARHDRQAQRERLQKELFVRIRMMLEFS